MENIFDYFFYAWEEILEKEKIEHENTNLKLLLDNLENQKEIGEFLSIILCINSKNILRFLEIEVLIDLFHKFSIKKEKANIQSLQIYIFNGIKENKINPNFFMKNIENLKDAKIISLEDWEKIKDLLTSFKPSEKNKISTKEPANQNINFYKNESEKLFQIMDSFINEMELQGQKQKLYSIKEQLNNASFSIGITGIINAGKSTVLNALMRKEILGTSVVPETANLSILKYSKEPYALINFWTKEEWNNIEESANSLVSMQKFVDESKSLDLDQYIKDEGESLKIKIEDLSLYTSAKNIISNLVKSIELYVDLDFLKNGVSIVDTPGLDDPVIQREEITKTYVGKCDLMIHLMNVNQVATQKDVEFILDALTYGGVSRLLIIVSKIDTVSKKELEEALEYTKKSIKNQLTINGHENQFDSILEKIDFLPIAGLPALMHRTNKSNEALSLGYTLEDTSILKLEDYLKDVLFGKNSDKVNLIINAGKKGIKQVCDISLFALLEEKENLGKNSDELKKEFQAKVEKNNKTREKIQSLKNKIENEKDNLIDFFKTLENVLITQSTNSFGIIKQRIIDDFSYNLRKKKEKPQAQRLSTIIEIGIKDAVVDIIRDYRFSFQKRMESSLDNIILKNENFILPSGKNLSFDVKKYLQRHFGTSFVSSSNAILIKEVHDNIKKYNLKEINLLEINLTNSFNKSAQSLNKKLLSNIDNLNKNLLNEFMEIISNPLIEMEILLKDEEKQMKEQLFLIDGEKEKLDFRLLEISRKINILKTVKLELA